MKRSQRIYVLRPAPQSLICKAQSYLRIEWNFVLRAVLGSLGDKHVEDMTTIEGLPSSQAPIPMPDETLEQGPHNRSKDLYFMLVMTTNGEARILVQQYELPANGYEAYRMLVQACDPSTSTRGLTMLEGVLEAKFDQKRFLQDLQAWRLLVTRYETKQGRPLTDDVKSSVVLRNLPKQTRIQLTLDAEREGYTFAQLIGVVTNFYQAQRANTGDQLPKPVQAQPQGGLQQGGPAAMEVDATFKGGPGGKGKPGTGKGGGASRGAYAHQRGHDHQHGSKGHPQGGSGDKGKAKGGPPCSKCGKPGHKSADCWFFDGTCNFCGGYGHRERDCKKKAAEGKGRGDGSVNNVNDGASQAPASASQPGSEARIANITVQEQPENEDLWMFGLFESANDESATGLVSVVGCDPYIEFLVDSGSEANVMMTATIDELGLETRASNTSLFDVAGKEIPTLGITADVSGKTVDDHTGYPFDLQFKCHVSETTKNVISVARLSDAGIHSEFYTHHGELHKAGKMVMLQRRVACLLLLKDALRQAERALMVQVGAPPPPEDLEDRLGVVMKFLRASEAESPERISRCLTRYPLLGDLVTNPYDFQTPPGARLARVRAHALELQGRFTMQELHGLHADLHSLSPEQASRRRQRNQRLVCKLAPGRSCVQYAMDLPSGGSTTDPMIMMTELRRHWAKARGWKQIWLWPRIGYTNEIRRSARIGSAPAPDRI